MRIQLACGNLMVRSGRRGCNPRNGCGLMTRVNWGIVNRDHQYNAAALEASLFQIFATQPLPSTAEAQVHYYTKALTHAFHTANKTLPQGHRRDPIPWCPPELDRLLAERNHVWRQIVTSHDLEDETTTWKTFEELSDKFRTEVNHVQRQAWRDFCETLDYSTDSTRVSRVIDSLTDTDRSLQTSSSIRSQGKHKQLPNNKPMPMSFTVPASLINQPLLHPNDLPAYNLFKQKVQDYVHQHDNSPDANPFTMAELKSCLKSIHKKRAVGDDSICAEAIHLGLSKSKKVCVGGPY